MKFTHYINTRAVFIALLLIILLVTYNARAFAQDVPPSDQTDVPAFLQPLLTVVFVFIGGALSGGSLVFAFIGRARHNTFAMMALEKLYQSAPIALQEQAKAAGDTLREAALTFDEMSDGIAANEKLVPRG